MKTRRITDRRHHLRNTPRGYVTPVRKHFMHYWANLTPREKRKNISQYRQFILGQTTTRQTKKELWYDSRGKTRNTYELILNEQGFLNFESHKQLEDWLKEAKETNHPLFKTQPSIRIVPKNSDNYRLGEMWRGDFDYVGMVTAGSQAKLNWGVKNLQKLYNSYEDVNYHTENQSLGLAIEHIKNSNMDKAEVELSKFTNSNKELLAGWRNKA